MLDFINSNYIWLIIIAVVLLLALIGYIAEKNGFGKKLEKIPEKKEDTLEAIKESVLDEKTEEPIEEISENNIEETPNDEVEEDSELTSEKVDNSNEENIDEDLYAPLGDQEFKNDEEEKDDVETFDFTDSDEKNEKIDEPTFDFSEDNKEQSVVQDNSNPFDSVEELKEVKPEKLPIDEEPKEKKSMDEDLYAAFEDMEEKDKEDKKETTEEEDIWKF